MRAGAAAPPAPCLRSRAAQLAGVAALLLLAGPVTQLLHEAFLPHGVRHASRGQRDDPHRLGMHAFVGATAHAHDHHVSAVASWHADEAKRAAAAAEAAARAEPQQGAQSAAEALAAAVSAHVELDRLHAQQREMIELHLAGAAHGDEGAAEAEAERWMRAELADYQQKHHGSAGAADAAAARSGGGGAAAAGAGGSGEGSAAELGGATGGDAPTRNGTAAARRALRGRSGG
jgi:hypothetical protein